MKDKLIEPGDEKTFEGFALRRHRKVLCFTDILQVGNEAVHAGSGILEEFGQIVSKGADARVTGYVNDLKFIHYAAGY